MSFHRSNSHFIYICCIIITLPALSTSKRCLIEKETYYDPYYGSFATSTQVVNCSKRSWCCEDGCCSVPWYTWPLALLFMVVLMCCLACVQALWDVYCKEEQQRSRGETAIEMSPPPDYDVAIYFPQPDTVDRVPSYEEVIRGE